MSFKHARKLAGLLFVTWIFINRRYVCIKFKCINLGSNISPIIADIVINNILYEICERVPFHFLFIFQYVDGIKCYIPSNGALTTLHIFNSIVTYNSQLKLRMDSRYRSLIRKLEKIGRYYNINLVSKTNFIWQILPNFN